MRALIKLVSSTLYSGYSPVAPGTAGSLIGFGVYFLVRDNPAAYVIVALIVISAGFLVSGRAEKIFGEKDSGKINIDELSGVLVALFLVKPVWIYTILAFVLFRLFDIIKIPPTKALEKLPGSAGIMLDDIVAGLYANLVVQLIIVALK